MQRLPIFATVRDAYTFLWSNRQDFFSLSYLMIVVNSLLGVAIQVSLPPGWGTEAASPEALLESDALPLAALALIISMVLYIMFAIAWHRMYLVGAERTTVWAALRWRRRHWCYAFKLFALAVVCAVFIMILSFVVGAIVAAISGTDGEPAPGMGSGMSYVIIFVVLGLVAMMLVMRMSLAFPAVAVDDAEIGLRGSWRLTRGNGWALVLIMLLVSLPVGVAAQLIELAVVEAIGVEVILGSMVLTLIVSLIQQIFSFAGIAVSTSALSIAYQDLRAMHPPSAAPTV